MKARWMTRGLLLIAVLMPLTVWSAPSRNSTEEWPQWRGPHRNGICEETGLLQSFSRSGPPLLWKRTGLGKGYSSVVIHDGRIFTMGKIKNDQCLLAIDINGGKILWSTKVSSGGVDPNCTPTTDGNLVYALGTDGDLLCADAATGSEVWRKSFPKDFGGKMMSGWGYSESPLIDGDKLICTPGGKDAAIVALNKSNGELIWKAAVPNVGSRGKDGAAYSSVAVSDACGIHQYVQLMGRGVVGVDAKDGKYLWGYNRIANDTANIPTPIVDEDYVFCSTGYGAGSALLKLVPSGSGNEAKEVYFLEGKKLQNHHGGLVLVDGHIYGGHQHNEGFPFCLEMKTGKFKWRQGRGPGQGSAAVVYADGNMIFRYQSGKVAMIEASPKAYKAHGSFDVPKSEDDNSWAHPVVVGGKLYLRERDELFCYDMTGK